LAATSVGADGLIIEVHHKPKEALCDGAQSLYPNQFEECVKKVNKIHSLIKA
jgi:3-deoxy-7-phosphoheptulonate synthase